MKLNSTVERLGTLGWLWMQKHWFVSGLALLIGSCAFMTRDRTVTWEEEVPLNTGETIVVKRTGRYIDFDYDLSQNRLGYKPDPVSTIEFTYKGKRYSFTSEGGLQLLAIGPDGLPNLIAHAGGDWGPKNRYSCDAPYFVQFRPFPSGNEWAWPPRIENWLYNQPTNLVLGLAETKDDGKRFTPSDRQLANASAYAYSYARYIDPTYFSDGCIRSK